MKYSVMIVKSERENYGSLYQYLTCSIDGVIQPVILEENELNDFVADMLNNQGYSKSDFIIISIKDYCIDLSI